MVNLGVFPRACAPLVVIVDRSVLVMSMMMMMMTMVMSFHSLLLVDALDADGWGGVTGVAHGDGLDVGGVDSERGARFRDIGGLGEGRLVIDGEERDAEHLTTDQVGDVDVVHGGGRHDDCVCIEGDGVGGNGGDGRLCLGCD